MNPGLTIFKKRQRLQGGKEDVEPDPTNEQLKAIISQYDDAIAEQKRQNALDEAFARRAGEIPPILNKLPGQYQDYYPTQHEEVPVKRSKGRRYFDPGALGEYPIMAQGGTEEVRGKVPPFFENGKWWWEKPDAGVPKLRPMSEMPENEEDLSPEELRREQEDYKRRVRESQYIQAQRGTSNVQYLQGGTSGLNYDPSYPGPTNPKESGSGYWTQKGVGTGVGIASNFIFPGLGLLTGPLASWAMRAMQSGMAQNAVQQAVQNYQQQAQQASDRGEAAPTVPDDPTGVSSDRSHHAGVGIDPEGNPADPGEWWSNDFGRWNTDKEGGFPGELGGNTQGGPGLSYGHFGTGFGSGTVGNWSTAIGFGGNLGGSGVVDPTALGGHVGGMSSPMARAALAQYGSGYQFSNPSAFGAFTQSSPQEQRHFLPRQNQQMGTSNVGLNLFRRKQKLKKNQKL